MLSYQGSKEIKQKFIDRFAAHRAADEVIQGTGFDNGRGCFIGCTMNAYDHEAFANQIGPLWLAYLADKIFEGIPKSEAAQFGTDLLAAIPEGMDLDIVRPILGVARMDRLIKLHKDCDKYGLLDALTQVKQLHEREITKTADSAAYSAAYSAARSAAYSAYLARSADSAARSAADSARSAADSARSAADSAADSARSAADSAAYSAADSADSAAWIEERDTLLTTLRNLTE